MTGKLLKKEFALCLHPTTPIMVLLAALTLTPNYPYTIVFFFLSLGVFFICLTGRENNDVTFSLTLPVSRRDIVTARFLLVICMEAAQLLLLALCVWLHGKLDLGPNAAGTDANLTLLGEGLVFYAVFHLVFFPSYYGNVQKVGVSFVKSSAVLFLLTIADIVFSYALPLSRDVLDTPDPAHLSAKLVFILCGAAIYPVCTWIAWRVSVRRFEKLDIR